MVAPLTPPQSPTRLYLQPQASTTPHRPKLAHSHGSQSGALDNARADLARDASWIPVVSYADFQQHVLPVIHSDRFKLDSATIDEIMSSCLSEGVICTDIPG